MSGLSRNVARAVSVRVGILERLGAWGRAHRDPGRHLVWFHAASVGEGLHAKPVLDRLRARHPDWQFFYTHFSPSAERFAQSLHVDGCDYLPFDRPHDVAVALSALTPNLLVLTNADVWPELIAQAHSRRVRVALCSATVSATSRRLRWPLSGMLRGSYRSLDLVSSASPRDLQALLELGARPERARVLGNTRFDSARDQAALAPNDPWVRRLRSTRPTIVAGSTWPADESVVLSAFARLLLTQPNARLVVAPHETTQKRLRSVVERVRVMGLEDPATLARLDEAEDPSIVLVDRVGHLAALYSIGQLAYVGGGFGRKGLHSVLEPAACGLPVVVGPYGRSASETVALQQAGALHILPTLTPDSALGQLWHAHLTDPALRREAGRAARQTIDEGAGATARTTDALEALLGVTE